MRKINFEKWRQKYLKRVKDKLPYVWDELRGDENVVSFGRKYYLIKWTSGNCDVYSLTKKEAFLRKIKG
jgi:hypothetical protein